ncbi:DNA topoisomerase I, partial [bacterium]|nr:DNA topoisomerase I [bacterium]
MKLIIVESPTKAKTISQFLKDDFVIESCNGHIRDLPRGKMGIDIENNFQPQYVIPTKKRKIVNKLKKIAEKAEKIYLATDEDREGEAISWHLSKILPKKEIKRIAFHEITEEAVKNALKNPREINLNLVNSQQARRILDRLVGYSLSPLLWKKIAKGLSAGRVQSPALRLICEREKEIEKFKPKKYWSIKVKLQPQIEKDNRSTFWAKLFKIDNKILEKLSIDSEKKVNKILKDLKEANYFIL